jgi:hypothetical protein
VTPLDTDKFIGLLEKGLRWRLLKKKAVAKEQGEWC